jgi:N-acetylmuramoyl-L-alanine amidase
LQGNVGSRARGLWLGGCLAAVCLAVAPLQASEPGGVATGNADSAGFDTVVLDAGHGGGDHGAAGPAGLLEKDLVLDVADRVAERLRASGLTVILTRSTDDFVALEERTRLANEAGADLFVSIHANASRFRGVRGIETFFASSDATDEAARELANTENQAFGTAAASLAKDDPLLAILGDLLANEHLSDSQEFARTAQQRLAQAEASRSRGVKQAPFVVLMGVRMPAVLVELGFLTNSGEERALNSNRERDRLAQGLAEAVAEFRVRQNKRLGVAPGTGGGR